MKYVQDRKLTDTLERELIRSEVAKEQDQPKPFAAIVNAAEQVLAIIADMKATARRHKIEYVNG